MRAPCIENDISVKSLVTDSRPHGVQTQGSGSRRGQQMRWSNVVPQTETRCFIRASLVTVGSCPVCHLAGSVKKLNLVNASD
jgi:hypothetical protein